MNASDILHYGHTFVTRNIVDLPLEHWETPNVCGWWSTKLVIGHLASFEHMLIEVLRSFQSTPGSEPTPYLDMLNNQGGQLFNDFQIEMRQNRSAADLLAEYTAAAEESYRRVSLLDGELLRRPGTLPWYGAEYALDDYIVYQYYGHKREHTAQINVFKDALKAAGKLPR
ncbi:MAG: maleylpyruvate isomerase N-terminal domain-containing protein [Anaerolineales bacterium]|nr:maleylpyruvate isomerase N-terminal domain-containing protein [Anaerolineales bacterium]